MNDVIPDKVQPETAWRAWRALRHEDAGELRLVSMNAATLGWPVHQPLRATCHYRRQSMLMAQPFDELAETVHDAPGKNCQCGIYGASLREALRYIGAGPTLFGRVALWGKVVPGKQGFRAEYAYPLSLVLPTPWLYSLRQSPQTQWEEIRDLTAEAAGNYRVEVEEMDARFEIEAGVSILSGYVDQANQMNSWASFTLPATFPSIGVAQSSPKKSLMKAWGK